MKPLLCALVLGCYGWLPAIWADFPTPEPSYNRDQRLTVDSPDEPQFVPLDSPNAPHLEPLYARITAEKLAQARLEVAGLLKPGQRFEDAQTAAFKIVQEFDNPRELAAFAAEVEKQLAHDPDSPGLNLAMAALTHESYPQSLRLRTFYAPNAKLPVWLRLTRDGEEVRTSASNDGERWTELDHQVVPLGKEPLAVLSVQDPPLAWNKVLTPNVNAVFDHVALAPVEEVAPTLGPSALPVPWTETALPPLPKEAATVERKPEVPPAPSSIRPDGAMVLRADEGYFTQPGDSGRLVHRPLGSAQTFSARILSFEPNSSSSAGIMLRASTEADAPFGAVLINSEGAIFTLYRQGELPSLTYWRKLAALRPGDRTTQLALAEELSWYGHRAKAIAVCDSLIASDPLWMFGSQDYELHRIFDEEAAPQLGDSLLAWQPSGPLSEEEKGQLARTFGSTAAACEKQQRYDLVVALYQRSIALYDPSEFSMDRSMLMVHPLLLDALIKLDRRDEACDELLSRLVPPPPSAGTTEGADDKYRYTRWLSYGYNDDGVDMGALSALDTARQAGLLAGLETALRRRMTQSDALRLKESGIDWLLTMIRLYRRDPTVLAELPALLSGKTGNGKDLTVFSGLGPDILRLMVARQLQLWPGQERLALMAFRSATRLRAAVRRGGSDEMEPAAGLQMARAEIQLGDEAAATGALGAVMEGLAAEGGTVQNSPRLSKHCMALLLQLDNAVADQTFLQVLDHVREAVKGKGFDADYEREKQLRLGNVSQFDAQAWLLDPSSNEAVPTLVYELQPHDTDEAGRVGSNLEARGRSFPAMLIERKLHFQYGRDAGHLQDIGEVKTLNTWGTWQGALPSGTGLLKVALETSSGAAAWAPSRVAPRAGAAMTVLRSPNLLANPDFAGLAERDPDAETFALSGWKDLPRGFWLPGTLNSPLPGKAFVQCELFSYGEHVIHGARVPVEKGRAYLQTGWLRDEGGDRSRVRFGRSYLDEDGKVLKTTDCPDPGSLVWRRVSQRLYPTDEPTSSNPADETMPPGTKFIEPYLKCAGAVAWTGLYVAQTE